MTSKKTISRTTKGAIAAVAGGALLLGTGATFAVWNASGTLTGATIETGSLDLIVNGFEWVAEGPGLDGPQALVRGGETDKVLRLEDGTPFAMIPGHVVTGTAEIRPALNGTGLQATLMGAPDSPATSSSPGAEFKVDWYVNGVQVATGSQVVISDLPAHETSTLEVEVSLPENGAPNASWTLEDIKVTLEQATS